MIHADSASWLRVASELGVWDIVQTVLQLGAVIVGAKVIFFPRRRIDQLDFFAEVLEGHSQFPRAAKLTIQNYTGSSVVISAPYFRCGALRSHPSAAGHAESGDVQLKFPEDDEPKGRQRTLAEVEKLLRNKESTWTLIPFDGTETVEAIRTAIANRELGVVDCKVTWLKKTPKQENLHVRI